MRQKHPHVGLGELCVLFGVTRQAYYDAFHHAEKTSIANMIVLTLVKEIRSVMPLLGTRKLLYLLEPQLKEHGIKIGRDQLFDLLRFHGLMIRRRKRIVRTTDSNHIFKRYPNLIKELVITGREQLWVSDITYIRTIQGFSYLSLITDAYSHKIVGYALHPTLEATGCLKALEMAISTWKHESPFYLIHHSDRGIQYCCAEYTETLQRFGVAISMTQSGSPYDNALAERVNGILKNEFFPKRIYQNHKDAQKHVSRIIAIYNESRPHGSIDYLSPAKVHESLSGPIRKRWKQYRRYRKTIPDENEFEHSE
ncbi:transposase InsO family protein [Arcticibacter tournemirensis]|uniref:IS3 family transposase n=1 Tax=Arcticibacter tournemirensis TaxID=699437 RepID=A0A543GUD1_9SPHI|nr:IS3 family transposase [Arcticibacter tournemirensis]KAA8473422.1 IS3 family transposase [Arcticibacter tournemirensis]TQM49667.1 transposase InsO family protein [Arcticibacter tournemirensis]TQM50623.1 transposase InsO family protein [Arcticibacter tournemirensis]TQM51736.1 transposase InsO family protein [Arcticibacter tournemirensis]